MNEFTRTQADVMWLTRTFFCLQGDTKYISFVPDRGGWNNVRMSMEIIFVIAAATGRTLVLPPDQPLYLLHVSALMV
jgi:hypothetical protein